MSRRSRFISAASVICVVLFSGAAYDDYMPICDPATNMLAVNDGNGSPPAQLTQAAPSRVYWTKSASGWKVYRNGVWVNYPIKVNNPVVTTTTVYSGNDCSSGDCAASSGNRSNYVRSYRNTRPLLRWRLFSR